MKKELNWAVLGCGVIANEMAQALEHIGKTEHPASKMQWQKS